MSSAPKVAHFTIAANMEQSARWKQVAEAAGHPAVSSWLAEAADAYVEATAPKPTPESRSSDLTWHGGRFRVVLTDDREIEVRGMISYPFGQFQGSSTGPSYSMMGRVLVHLPTRRIIASARTAQQIREMAAGLAPTYLREEAVALGIAEGREAT